MLHAIYILMSNMGVYCDGTAATNGFSKRLFMPNSRFFGRYRLATILDWSDSADCSQLDAWTRRLDDCVLYIA